MMATRNLLLKLRISKSTIFHVSVLVLGLLGIFCSAFSPHNLQYQRGLSDFSVRVPNQTWIKRRSARSKALMPFQNPYKNPVSTPTRIQRRLGEEEHPTRSESTESKIQDSRNEDEPTTQPRVDRLIPGENLIPSESIDVINDDIAEGKPTQEFETDVNIPRKEATQDTPNKVPSTEVEKDDNVVDKSNNNDFQKEKGEDEQQETKKFDEVGNLIQDDAIDFVWEVGDVEEDFKALEQVLIQLNAEENLKHAERLEILDAHSAQRRPLLPDIYTFVSGTVVWTLIFTLLKKLALHRTSSKLGKLCARRLINLPWDIHFWAVVVAAPLLFLQVKRATLGEPPPMPEELQNLPQKYRESKSPFVNWEDPRTSCNDYILCLAEQWVSAIEAVAIFGVFMTVCNAILFWNRRTTVVFSGFAMGLIQFLTRLGAIVSVFQYPSILFKLQRSQQPRPLTLEVATLQGLVQSLLRWGLPIGLASDLSKMLMISHVYWLVPMGGALVTFLSAMEMRYNQSRKPRPPGRLQQSTKKATAILAQVLEFILTTGVPCAVMIAISSWVMINVLRRKTLVLPRLSSLHIVTNGILCLTFIRPIWHLALFSRIVEIVYTHDLSLTTDPETMQQTLNNPQERQKRYTWRSRLKWREPERIHVVFDRAWRNYKMWFFLSGTVQDKLLKEDQERRKNNARVYEETILGPYNIWEKVKREMEHSPDAPKPNRDLWKQKAMEDVAYLHQTDYDKGRPYNDPLGVALQQRLGIGFRSPKDHTKRRLAEDGPPTPRQLHTRAIKSAIARVNKIWEEVKIARQQIDEEVEDPLQKKMALQRLEEKRVEEFNYLSRRLTELLPARSPGSEQAFQFLGYTTTTVVGGQRIRITASKGDISSLATQEILKSYEIKILKEKKNAEEALSSGQNKPTNSTGIDSTTTEQTPSESDYYDYGADRDAFMQEWLKRRFSGSSPKKNVEDEDEDDTNDGSDDQRIVLV